MITKIKVQYYPAKFGKVDFSDYIVTETARLIRLPVPYSNIVMTNEKHSLVDENKTIERKIQSVVYDRYKISFVIQEYQDISGLKVGDKLTIETTHVTNIGINTYTYDAIIDSDLDVSQISNTTMYRVDFTFRDIKPDSEAISNYLTSDYLLEQYEQSDLWHIELSSDKNIGDKLIGGSSSYSATVDNSNFENYTGDVWHITIPFVSELNILNVGDVVTLVTDTAPIDSEVSGEVLAFDETEIKFVTLSWDNLAFGETAELTVSWSTEADYINLFTNLVPKDRIIFVREAGLIENDNEPAVYTPNMQKFKALVFTLFLNEAEKTDYDLYASGCFYDTENGRRGVKVTAPDGSIYFAQERLSPEIEDDTNELIDVYKREVIVKYEQLNHYMYA